MLALLTVAISATLVILFRRVVPTQPGSPRHTLTLGAYRGDTCSLVWIANERGYFTRHGLDLVIREHEAGKLAVDALVAGDVDVATAAEFVVVSNGFNHPDLRVVGTIARAETMEVIARKDHGIGGIADLRGKRIGVTRKSTAEFFLGSFLLFNGLVYTDVELVDLTPSQIVEAMDRGTIDASLTWDPNIYEIKRRLGNNAVHWPGQSGQDFYFVLVTRNQWAEGNGEALQRFLRAVIQAQDDVERSPDQAQRMIAERFRYDAAYVRYIWPRHQFTVALPQALLIAMEDEARRMIENDLTDAGAVPNYLNYLSFDSLQIVRPEAISVIR